jgi:hypothetical protein
MRFPARVAMAAVAVAAAALLAPEARADDDHRSPFRGTRVGVSFGAHPRAHRFVPGRWVESVQRVVIRAGYWRTERVPAAYEVRFDLCEWRFVKVLVRAESTRRVWVAPVVEERIVRTWSPGRWECGCRHHG